MSAIERAAEMRGPVETFGGFAHLEVAAIDDERRLATLLAICDDALDASQALLAAKPGDPEAPRSGPQRASGFLAGLLGARNGDAAARARELAAMDAWDERVEALDAETTSRVAAWRAAVDADWLASATADRDAALESLVERGAATREMVDIVAGYLFGDLLLRAALAHD